MQGLPSKSLSKPILFAIPLFCLVLAILDTADELSYLFILQFLDNMAGTPDITFLPSQQSQVGEEYSKLQLFKYNGINLRDSSVNSTTLPLVTKEVVEQWADQFQIIRGVSPRWLIPTKVNRTDSLVLVADVAKELEMRLGMKSMLQRLGDREVALPQELLTKSGKKVGDSIDIKLSIKDIFNGRRLIEKYQNLASEDEDGLVEQQDIQIDKLSEYIYNVVQQQGKPYNVSISEEQVKEIVEYLYQLQFSLPYTIKYQYQNSGLFASALSNVVLMEFDGFARLLSTFALQKIIRSKTLQKLIYTQIDQSSLDASQTLLLKFYLNSIKSSSSTDETVNKWIRTQVEQKPLMMVASYEHRELVYHPQKIKLKDMYMAMQASPIDFTVISTYPLYQALVNIRFFFKSIIQIFIFVCGVIFFYTMRLILQQIYEEKQIQVGIWRVLGAGGVREKVYSVSNSESQPFKKGLLNTRVTLWEKCVYGWRMLLKVGFIDYWFISCLLSAFLYQLAKACLYILISDVFHAQSNPPLGSLSAIILFFVVLIFTTALVGLHIRQIYVNPLVSTIKPVKRTFDVVKIRVIKIATFGITVEMLLTGAMLVYYGVVSYYWIPVAILEQNGSLQTILFNSIFIFLILGGIMLLVVLQSRLQCAVLNLLFKFSKRLATLKLIMLKSIKAKQYKNIKVSLIISLIFAFLLFVTAGINIELKIIQSFSQRDIGSDLMIQNLQKVTLNRTQIQQYLNPIKGIKYAWFSQNLERQYIKIGFQTITKKGTITCAFRAVTPNFLDVTYYQYYYPELYYQPQLNDLETLPNGVKNGFTTLYQYDGQFNNKSIGRYDPSDTIIEYDPHQINVAENKSSIYHKYIPRIPHEEQVINVVITSLLRRRLGARAGDFFKLTVNNSLTGEANYFRCRVMHSLKVAPGVDLFRSFAYLSQDQARYIFKSIGYDPQYLHFNKLFITGTGLKQIGNKILSMSPDHTSVVQISQVRQSFQLIENYLNGFILFITIILAFLSVLFLTVYTYGKCREEAQIFKMLRAVGLPVDRIRLMVFLEVLVRMVVAIINGTLLGIVFSIGLMGQVEEVLMLKAELPSLWLVVGLGAALLCVFSLTVVKSTSYLANRTVLQTAKL